MGKQYLRINNFTISTPLIDIVKDIRNQIVNGKLKTIQLKSDNIRVTCPFHSGGFENRASSDIFIGDSDKLEYGWFKCFTCGESSPFYHFVSHCFDISDEAAKKWLIDNYADSEIVNSFSLPEIDLSKPKTRIISDTVLQSFESFSPYVTGRKLSKSILDLFEVKYDKKSKCIVFPVRNEKGQLVGLTRRSVNDKRFIIDENFDKTNIYLLPYVKQRAFNTCIICESQINALTCYSYGFPAVALYGAGTTEAQVDALNRSGIIHFILMYDNDQAGHTGCNKFKKLINKDKIITEITMPFHKDINDLTRDEFYALLRKYDIPIKNYMDHIVYINESN